MLLQQTGWLLKKPCKQQGAEAKVSGPVHLCSRIAYIWWIAAYVTGTLMVMLK